MQSAIGVALNNGERTSLMKISKELKEVQAQKREILREEKRLKGQIKLQDDLERWKELTELKQQFVSRLSEAKFSRGYSLAKLGKMQDYYIFQNPKNKKQKAVDNTTKWVKDYLSKGGNEADLISQANITRSNYWRRMNPSKKRKQKSSSKKSSNKISSGKSAAIKQQGVG